MNNCVLAILREQCDLLMAQILYALYLTLFVVLMRLLAMLLFAILLHSMCGQEIVDYSHTACIQKSQLEENKHYDIAITPPIPTEAFLEFPYACGLHKQLLTSEVIESNRIPLTNEEDFVNNLKANMTAFLRLSEKIRTQRAILSGEAKALPAAAEEEPIPAELLEELRDLELGLVGINTTIEEKVKGLSKLIEEEINRTKDSGFNELRLNFELSSYEARVRFLNDLRASKGKRPEDPSKKINNYFDSLNGQFNIQTSNLKQLEELLNSFAETSALRLRITNQKKKLEAKNHLISNKQECRLKNVKPINDQNRRNVAKITQKLRQLKKLENPNREHCEGVALKLLAQIKKVLKAYNYSHSCEDGLEKLRREKEQLESNIKNMEIQYQSLQYDPKLKRIQSYFNKSRAQKEEFINQVQTFDIDLYVLHPALIDQQIHSLNDKIKAIRYKIEHPPEGEVRPFDNEQVRERISEINQAQHNYCKLKDQYEEKYRAIDKTLRKYEFKVGQAVAQNQEYLRRASQLALMEKEFHQLRNYLLTAIK